MFLNGLRALIFLLVVTSFFLRGADLSAPSDKEIPVANIDFKTGLEHWKVVPGGKEARVEILASSGHEGKPGIRLISTPSASRITSESESFNVTPGTAYRLTFWARNVGNRSKAGVFIRFFGSNGKELNNAVKGHDTMDQDIAIIGGATEAGWMRYEIIGIPPEGTIAGSIRYNAWQAAIVELSDLHLTSFAPMPTPPWPSAYKISPEETSRLTEADVVGPDGRVYPDWHLAGVSDGLPKIKTVVDTQAFAGLEKQDIADALEKAIAQAARAGGGAIELPAGTFFLDRSLLIDQNGIVLRGAGPDKTRLIFRDRIPYGTVRLFNWAGAQVQETGPGGAIEIQANPKGLASLSLRCKGVALAQNSRKMHWGNTYWLRITGKELLKKLGPGSHLLEGNAGYENGDHFTAQFKVTVVDRPIEAPATTYNAAIFIAGHGPQGEKIPLTADGKRGDKRIQVQSATTFHPGDLIRIEAPATERWNNLVGNHCPWGIYRVNIYEVVGVEESTLRLAQPLRIEFPVVDGASIQKIAVVRGTGIEDLTLEQEIVTANPSGPKNSEHWYNIEDLWTNGITFSYAWGCWAKNLRVLNAGRNPVYLPNSKFCEVRDCEFDDSLFKGGGGSAYVGFETSFDCLMTNVTTRRLRHAPDLQWGASGNVIRDSTFNGSDAQFHAGWTNENLLEGNRISSDAADAVNGGYGFGIFASGPSSPEHGPQGPRNVIYRNDVTSPSSGLVMLGGNEGWLVLFNRFRINTGYAVVGKETTFDHIIAGNVFIIDHPATPAVYFKTPSCTGIELLDNKFYGAIDKVAGFKGGFGSLAHEKGNEVFPLSSEALSPLPEVKSIFLWQRGTIKK